MPDVQSALTTIAADRKRDPLAPVTVVTPSHAAGLQMRRRLAAMGPFAAVRFETLPRIAELLAAGHLAAAGRSPLARPIGDHVAQQVALESRGVLARVRDLPGYARALRQVFRRLRRGGITGASDVRDVPQSGHLGEVLRLYDRFRQDTAGFYDEEDLMEAAAQAVERGRAGALGDLGAIYVVPPGAESAGGVALLAALREAAPAFQELHESQAEPETRIVLASDPASEAREAVREVISALESGAALDEVAVFHSADQSYRRLLREALEAAKIPVVPLPGICLMETPAARGVLALALLPERAFSRTLTMDFFSVAPLRQWLPGQNRDVRALATAWDRVSREAGVTRGPDRWSRGLRALIADCEGAISDNKRRDDESRVRAVEYRRDLARDLQEIMESLITRLEPLRQPQPATSFIEAFSGIVDAYLDPDAEALDEVRAEIEQLGTVGAVGGSISLSSFALALRANLEAAYLRRERLGDGIVLADYRAAAGLQFKRVVLCGSYEGALPAGLESDAIIDDRVWTSLRREHPHTEDARLRLERGKAAAGRVVAAAAGGAITWSCPLYEPLSTREYYPSPLMVEAAARVNPSITTASQLRRMSPANGRFRKAPSPLAAVLRGPPVDGSEVTIRQAVRLRQRGEPLEQRHPLYAAVSMLRARRSSRFTEWDGNLAALSDVAWLQLQKAVSPTSLEHYAVCGFRYLSRSLLRLNTVEEPAERDVMEATARGELIHRVLDTFFKEMKARRRPSPGEPWSEEDRTLLMRLAQQAMAQAGERGLTGLDLYSEHELRTMRADLGRFLEADSAFRRETGAVPTELETEIPPAEIAGVRLRGRVDRIDRTPDGKRAWVIDYKTGSSSGFADITSDPLMGGTKLQLPVYLQAVPDAAEALAMYWFITQKGGFERVTYEATAENRALFERAIAAIVGGIRAGSFPAVPGDENEYYGGFHNCQFCEFDRICSRRRDYELSAKGGDRDMAPWQEVARAARREDEER